MKVFLKTKSIHMIFTFQTQQLKSYSLCIFSMLDSNLVQNDFFYEYGRSIYYDRAH
jgi:hypothetical protein